MTPIKFFALACFLLLSVGVCKSESWSEDSFKKELDDFVSRSEAKIRTARARKAAEEEEVRAQVEKTFDESLPREKRDAPEEGDPMKKLGDFFGQVKDGFNSAFQNVTSSNFYQQASAKFTELGQSFSESAKKLGASIEAAVKPSNPTSSS